MMKCFSDRLKILLLVTMAASCSDGDSGAPNAGDAGFTQGGLVVIGDSGAAGMVDMRQFAESQRWAYPTYLADRLGLDYSTPELAQVESDGELRDGEMDFFGIPDLRSLLNAPEIAVPYDAPPLSPVNEKRRPQERHTNLAVPGETVAGALHLNGQAPGISLLHDVLNGSPYYESVGGGSAVSQLEIDLPALTGPV